MLGGQGSPKTLKTTIEALEVAYQRIQPTFLFMTLGFVLAVLAVAV